MVSALVINAIPKIPAHPVHPSGPNSRLNRRGNEADNRLDPAFKFANVLHVLLWVNLMKTVSARQANHEFSDLLSRVERGEEILITKRSKPVAVLRPYRPPATTPEREKAIRHAMTVMEKGLRWGSTSRKFKRDEMHER